MGPEAMGINMVYRNVHTGPSGPRQGKESGSIVSSRSGPTFCTCPGPVYVQFEYTITPHRSFFNMTKISVLTSCPMSRSGTQLASPINLAGFGAECQTSLVAAVDPGFAP